MLSQPQAGLIGLYHLRKKKERCLVGRAPVEGLLQHGEGGVLRNDEPEFGHRAATEPEVAVQGQRDDDDDDDAFLSVEAEVDDAVVTPAELDDVLELEVERVDKLGFVLGHGVLLLCCWNYPLEDM